jgi:hypothetical protein
MLNKLRIALNRVGTLRFAHPTRFARWQWLAAGAGAVSAPTRLGYSWRHAPLVLVA